MKKFLSLLMIPLMLLPACLITACGGTPSDANGTPDGSSQAAPGVEETTSSGLLTKSDIQALADSEAVSPSIQSVSIPSVPNHSKEEKVITTPTFSIPDELKVTATAIKLDAILSTGMVLQADMPVRLWGTSTEAGGICARVTEDSTGESRIFYSEIQNGSFEIWLGATSYGGPYTIDVISETGKKTTMKNILFGEVYILGGQSNMGWFLGQCYQKTTNELRYQDIIDTCANDNIREVLVWPVSSETRVEALGGTRGWRAIAPSTVGELSAVGYFFGRELNAKLNVPVGLVSACMGGTGISMWFPGAIWYNGMVAPITKMVARGVLWYQGEGDYNGYAERLAEMIGIWREEFQNPDMLFHVIQLPRYQDANAWYLCREEDKKVCSLVEHCTYSVNIDTGMFPSMRAEGDALNDDGIHPYQKLEVGTRAADTLIEKVYGGEGTWTSPYLAEARRAEDGSVILRFENVGSGLMLEGLAGFEAAPSENGTYSDARPELISDCSVRLTSEDFDTIRKIRYGYTNNSSFIEGEITDCAQCVCLYNTIGEDKHKGYPAEQFEIILPEE